MRKHFKVAATLMLAAAACLGAGNTIHVPTDQPSIQAGIDAAANGDTVLVAPGLYYENINFHAKAVAVTSEQGAGLTVIDGRALDSVVSFVSGEGRNSVLIGFTVQNGRSGFDTAGFGSGGGIRINNASPTIQNDVVTNNRACDGLGISARFGSPLIQGTKISGNTQFGCIGGIGGGGISTFGTGTAEIRNNLIERNTLDSASGGGISLSGGTPILSGNIIRLNSAGDLIPCADGGGISIVSSDAVIVNNLITGNSAGCGGGLSWSGSGANAFLVNNTIAENISGGGAEIQADAPNIQVQLINNIVVALTGEYAIYCGKFTPLSPPPIFRFNDVVGDPGFAYGGNCTDTTGVNGNISADPLFTRPVSGNFHVRPDSPVVDAGTSESAPAVDLEGNPRPTDGNGDGVAAFDMGAYEGTMVGTDPDLRATLTNNVGGSVLFPNPWIWSIEVANHGAGSATFTPGQVILRDNLPTSGATYGAPNLSTSQGISGPGTISCAISFGNLTCAAGGGNVTIGTNGAFAVQFTVTPTGATATLTNPQGGGVCAADPDGAIAEADESNNNCSNIVNVTGADLQLTTTFIGGVSNGVAKAGTTVTYLITVNNNGPNTAQHAVLTENLPANVTFASCDVSAGSCVITGGKITVGFGSFDRGTHAIVTIGVNVNCDVTSGTVISNTASVTSAIADPFPGNNQSTATFAVSNPVPVINASVGLSISTQNNHDLVNVGLTATASDDACPAPTAFTAQVFGNEDDQTPTAKNEVYSPDAANVALGTLRLRAERVDNGNGRVYLIVVSATDAARATGFGTAAVVVPKSTSAASVASILSQAAAAAAYANANNGAMPPGYFVIGDGPVIGPKQ